MTPFVPVTVSRITAATVCGALVLKDLLEMRRARADRARIRVPRGAAIRVRVEHRTTPGMPGSFGQRRGSPVSEIAPCVAPW